MKTRTFFCFVIPVMMLIAVVPATAADRIKRKSSDTIIQGTVGSVSKTEVGFKTSSTQPERKIPVNEIERIQWDREPTELNLRRNDERTGRLEEALAGYEKALQESGAAQLNLKADLNFLVARVTAKMALADPGKLDEAVKKLEDFRKSNPSFYRYYEALDYLVRVYLAKKEYEPTEAIFREMNSAPWNDYKMAAQNYQARVKLLTGDVNGALTAYDAVIARPASNPSEISRRNDAMLGKATCLQKQNQSAEAVKLLEETANQVSPDETGTMAEVYLRMGDILREQADTLRDRGNGTEALQKSKQAVIAYLHLDVLQNLSREKALHAEALYHLSTLWKTIRHPDRAAVAEAKLKAEYPNSEWTKKLTAPGS